MIFYLSVSDVFRAFISISPAPNVSYGVGRQYVLPCSNGKICSSPSSSSARIRISLSLSYDGNYLTSWSIPLRVIVCCLSSDNNAASIALFPWFLNSDSLMTFSAYPKYCQREVNADDTTWKDFPTAWNSDTSWRSSLASIFSNCLIISGVYNLSPQWRHTPAFTLIKAVWLPPQSISVTSFSRTASPQCGHFFT